MSLKLTKQIRGTAPSILCFFVISTTCIFNGCDRAKQGQASAADSGQKKVKALPNPDKLVKQLFKALREKDFEAVYKNDSVVLADLEKMKKNEPAFVLEKRIQSYRDDAKINFEEELRGLDSFKGWDKMGVRQLRARGYSELVRYAFNSPEVKVVEIRLREKSELYPDAPAFYDVFVHLKFPSFDQAPLERAPHAGPGAVLPDDFEYKALKERVIQLVFNESGNFAGIEMGSSFPESDVFFDQVPLRIFGVEVTDPMLHGDFKLGFVGGTPRYSLRVEINGILINGRTGVYDPQYKPNSAKIDIYNSQYVFQGTPLDTKDTSERTNVPCFVSLTDSAGQKADVNFTIPVANRRNPNYKVNQWKNILDPWSKNGLERNLPPGWLINRTEYETLTGIGSGSPSHSNPEKVTVKPQAVIPNTAANAERPAPLQGTAVSANENIFLSQFPLLSQKSPTSYRAGSDLMDQVDTADGKKVKDLACLAAVYTMIDRGNGNLDAVIDDFYPDPRKAPGGITLGPTTAGKFEVSTQPKPIHIDTIISNLKNGVPSILLACQGPCQPGGTKQHFVLVVGAKFQNGGKKTFLTALDPYPSAGTSYDLDTSVLPMVPETLPSLTFQQMRLVDDTPQTSVGGVEQKDSVSFLIGEWTGVVIQPKVAPYETRITFKDCKIGSVCGSVSYPSYSCEGNLTYKGINQGKHYFSEKKTKGICLDEDFFLEPDGDTGASVIYLVSGKEVARAELKKSLKQ